MTSDAYELRAVLQLIMIGSKHNRTADPLTAELYRTENGWGEVDNCWGQLGYVNVMVYKPPHYEDIVPNLASVGQRGRWTKRMFRAERNADVTVREKEFGDMVAVALRNAALPFSGASE